MVRSDQAAKGCADCGYNQHPAALDFDHCDGEAKLFNISARLTRSWDSILKKSINAMLCACCHRIRTDEAITTTKTRRWSMSPTLHGRQTTAVLLVCTSRLGNRAAGVPDTSWAWHWSVMLLLRRRNGTVWTGMQFSCGLVYLIHLAGRRPSKAVRSPKPGNRPAGSKRTNKRQGRHFQG